MTLQPIENDRTRLLAYLPEYEVVVCRKCAFAIQPGAFSSHLLRHQIYRSERRDLLRSLSKLKLNHPDTVRLPSSCSLPIPCFPVYSGFICNAAQCGHAFVSQKRMSLHWSEVHGEPDSQAIDSRPAKLQTFFRGNKLKYFEVSPTAESHTPTASSEDNESVSFSLDHTTDAPYQDAKVVSGLDMVSLHYLYHYIASTALTISRGDESTYFWTHTIVEEAFKYEWLMYALLSTAAFHLATTSFDLDTVNKYIQAGLLYQEAGLPAFRASAAQLESSNGTALIAFARVTSIQRCAHGILEPQIYATTEDPLEESPTATLVEFLVLIRGRVELSLKLQDKLPQDSDLVFRGEACQVMQRLTQDQLTFQGAHPFLMHAVMAQLEHHASILEDRDIAKLCSAALLTKSNEEISESWVSTMLPNCSNADFMVAIVKVLQSSLVPARLAHEQSIRDNTAPPFPPLSRFPHLPQNDYARISGLFMNMSTQLPLEETRHLPTVMPEIIALLHCFGRANAYNNISAVMGGIETWTTTISHDFITMVEDRRPVALLTTAYFNRLLQQLSERYWFLAGHGDRLLANIRMNLSPKACEILDAMYN